MSCKVVSYVRVSTEEQAEHGYSIDVQQQVLADYATGHDLEVVEAFVESESAFKPGRPEFNRMVEFLEKHKAVSAVLVYKIDRISRNMSDYATLVEEMGLEIISATEQLPANATGRLMGDMQAAFSRYFSAQLSERVRDAMLAKARKGEYPGWAPVGYRNDKATGTVVVDPAMAAIVRELFETYANEDVPLSELVKWAKKRGLRTHRDGVMGKASIHRVLTNPFYTGIVRWGGVSAQGVHPAIIPQYLFDQVQEKLHGKGHRRTKRRFPFRGLLTCGYCGCQITASFVKGKYVYYHCTHGKGECPQPYIRQEALAQQLGSIVDNVQIPLPVVEQLMSEIRKGETQRRERLGSQREVLQSQADEIGRRRDQAYVDRLGGVIADERWKKLDLEWERQQESVLKRMQRIDEALHSTADRDAQVAFELLDRATELYSSQSADEQGEALRILVSNCRLKGEELEPDYRKPFDLVAHGTQTGDWYPLRDSNFAKLLHLINQFSQQKPSSDASSELRLGTHCCSCNSKALMECE